MKLLVMGASGQQGGAVARALLKEGVDVRVVGRDPSRLNSLVDLGAEAVGADFGNAESLKRALDGIDGAFLVTTWFESGCDAEVQQGQAFVDAAKVTGLEHLVFSSVGAADEETHVPHFASKRAIEQAITKSGLKHTILRPVWFMENFASPWFLPDIQSGTLKAPLDPTRKMQMVPVKMIGDFGATALLRPHDYVGEILQLASDSLTFQEVAEAISIAIGRTISYQQVPLDRTRRQLGKEMAAMFDWFNQVGYTGDFNQLQKWFISIPSFEDYLNTAQWVKKLSLHQASK